ncbi:MAG: solute carrier family 26 protein [Microscillaceae bacterium]|jgi:SulP family sulfate permease|nr:solute carrier family 26 protein [Microscillaceae bacterium]
MNLKRYFPIVAWLPNYPKTHLRGDISAGITVGIMLIPQGMAYAGIAGLPPVYGLYAALLPQLIYALLGTSRQLAVGPVAMDSLLVAAGVSALATIGTAKYLELAFLLAFLMGFIQFLFGIMGFGFLVNFLSRPVINGFTSGAAIIIAFSQLKHLLGIDLTGGNQIQYLIYEVWLKIQGVHWLTLGLGIGSILILKNIKKIQKDLPGALVVVVLGILVVFVFQLDKLGVKIVKNVPQGLPNFQIPAFYWSDIQALLPTALALALIAFMEAISVAKAMQTAHRDYEINANQELIALGSANILSSFFQCYPTTGGFSRTAVNQQAGAKTNLAAIISASIVALTLLFLTPWFYYLPHTVLAAIIWVAVGSLIDSKFPQFLWKNRREEFWLWLLTLSITLTIGIQEGILSGVFFSLAIMIYKTMRPHVAILGKLPDTDTYRNIARFAQAQTRPDVLIVRYDADLYFANINHFREIFKSMIEDQGTSIKLLVINAESINQIDSSALYMLDEFYQDLKNRNIKLYFSGIKGPLRDILYQVGFTQKIGEESFFTDEANALAHYDNLDDSQAQSFLHTVALQTNKLGNLL